MLLLGLPLSLGASVVLAQEGNNEESLSQAKDRKAVAVVIYNRDLALVREERSIKLTSGLNHLAIRDVSAQIMPETATLRSLSGANLTLLEQNFNFDLLTPSTLLDKNVGKQVTVVRDNEQTNQHTSEQATVMSNTEGPVLKYSDRIEAGLPKNARIVYSGVPSTLRDRPTLVIDLNSNRSGQQTAELTYLTHGLQWGADYVASLSSDEKTMNLSGWVTLTNNSGASYENAKLQLVAGQVNRPPVAMNMNTRARASSTMMPAPQSPMTQQNLFEYHLYTLSRPTTLLDKQTKQVALLSAGAIALTKHFTLDSPNVWSPNEDISPAEGERRTVSVTLSFENKGGDLGIPLPAGSVLVYKSDTNGQPQFIGADTISHTAKNQSVKLNLGKAFDITGIWKRTDFKRPSKAVIQESFSIELNNAKDERVQVRVIEPMHGDWTITEESEKHTKLGSTKALWDIFVPAQGKSVLTYTVRIKE